MRLFFPPFPLPPAFGCFVVLFVFFYRVFGRFVTRGVQKRDQKKRAKISSAAKKVSTYVTFLFSHGARRPLVTTNGRRSKAVDPPDDLCYAGPRQTGGAVA
jgi:hypothetical protein